MITVRLFAAAREAVGSGSIEVDAVDVGGAVDAAVARGGERLAELLPSCKVWLNGEEAGRSVAVATGDEVAILPPVSGGCGR